MTTYIYNFLEITKIQDVFVDYVVQAHPAKPDMQLQNRKTESNLTFKLLNLCKFL